MSEGKTSKGMGKAKKWVIKKKLKSSHANKGSGGGGGIEQKMTERKRKTT